MNPRTLVAAALLTVMFACPGPRPSGNDSGVMEPEDAGEQVDAGPGPVDAGSRDAGVVDAGPPPELRILRLLPPRGATAGGTSVTVQGSGFLRNFANSGPAAQTSTTVRFGSNQVVDFQIIDDTTIELRAPAGALGAASVTLQNPNGRFVCNNCFTYYEELSVAQLQPAVGPQAGGTVVTFTGQGFTNDTQVLVGSFASPDITFVSTTELKVVMPRGVAAGAADVNVYNKNGHTSLFRAYTYLAAPKVTAVEPPVGAVAGGTAVTLRGQGFEGATAVRFGANAGVGITVVDDATIQVSSPAASAAGAVDVTVEAPGGAVTIRGAFTYADAAGTFEVYSVYPHVIAMDE